ncbi:hypothetical protein L2D01_08510 [Hyphomonadaceae bacterium ML37]|nr:hypothetical protein L2D01_08510 [Hyphomonadaceae bacterium ML37]
MEITRVLGGGILITNTDDTAFTVERVVANGSPENGNCNNYDRVTLAPGRSHTVVFLLCGTVSRLEVRTNRGTGSFTFG